jgi:hypothetical protein
MKEKRRVKTAHIPHVDNDEDELDELDIVYPNYPLKRTYVVSGPLHINQTDDGRVIPGRFFRTIREAEEWVVSTYGDYYERIRDAEKFGRWAFRVKKGSYRSDEQRIGDVMAESVSGRATKFRVV